MATFVDAPSAQTLKFGAQKVTWSTAGQLIAEEFQMTFGMRELDSEDEVGNPNKAAYIPIKGRGSCVCQILSSSTVSVTRGETCTFVPNGGGTPRKVMAISEHQAFTQSGITKIPVDIVEVLNP
jgi:hypothetical protein